MEFESLDSLADPALPTDWQGQVDLYETFQQLWRTQLYTDVTFSLNGDDAHVLSAHKLVLSTRSPVFADMFYDPDAKVHNIYNIPDAEPKVFRFMLRHIYGFDIRLTDVQFALKLHKIAIRYGVESLKTKCERCIFNSKVTKRNVLDILEAADILSSATLKQRCVKIIQTETADALNSRELHLIPPSMVSTLLAIPRLSLNSEYELIEWVFSWAKNVYLKDYVHSSAREVLEPILPLLKFTNLTSHEFAKLMSERKGVLDENEGFSIFMNIGQPGCWPLPSWWDSSKEPRHYDPPKK